MLHAELYAGDMHTVFDIDTSYVLNFFLYACVQESSSLMKQASSVLITKLIVSSNKD